MDDCSRRNFVVVVMPIIYFLALNLTISLLITESDGRYLRPSDHGLPYQDKSSHATKDNAPEMLSFFNGGKKTVSLPEAKNVTGGSGIGGVTWWNNRERRRSRDAHKKHVRKIMLITSLVCGLTGVVLLAVSAVLFIVRHSRNRKQQPQPQLGVEWSKYKSVPTSALASASESIVHNDQL